MDTIKNGARLQRRPVRMSELRDGSSKILDMQGSGDLKATTWRGTSGIGKCRWDNGGKGDAGDEIRLAGLPSAD